MKIYRFTAALAAGVCLALPALAAEPVPDTLDLSDCRILAGKLYADAYRSTLAAVTKRARAGSLKDQKLLAGIATNRFACFLETVSDSAGWSIVVEDKTKDGAPGVTSTSANLADIETLQRNPAGLKALREAVQSAQAVADKDLGYRKIAARYVADYHALFQPADHADAYRNAVGVRAVACRNQGAKARPANALFCGDAKGAIASLHPLLPAERRAEQEAAGLAWAEDFLAGSAPSRPAE